MDVAAVEDVPEYAMLWLPPFPKPAKPISGYHDWQQEGIHLRSSTISSILHSAEPPQDSGGRQLVDINQDHTPESRAARDANRQHRRLAEGGVLVRLPLDDCFKIGEENSDWNEPYGTINEGQINVSLAPFDRLMVATRDFLYTRGEAFRFQRNYRLFNLLRESLGLKGGGTKAHWKAVPAELDQTTEDIGQGHDSVLLHSKAEESCVLLTDTENSVRGFLALLRREAEAGWDLDPPLQLARISAAFFSYIEHYDVFPEDALKTRFVKAAALARSSPRLLLDAHTLESALADGEGWNRTVWAAWGGQYGGAERGGLEKEIPEWPVSTVPDQEPDGDWIVNIVNDTRPSPPAISDAVVLTQARLGPEQWEQVRMLGHIPYARRRITSVIAPLAASSLGATDFRASMYQIVTVPSPWVASEGWRRTPSADTSGDFAETTQIQSDLGLVDPLEREQATIVDPMEIVLWVEASAVGQDVSGQSLVGMALRGRWGLFGSSYGHGPGQWWAFKAKDYVLPALWRA